MDHQAKRHEVAGDEAPGEFAQQRSAARVEELPEGRSWLGEARQLEFIGRSMTARFVGQAVLMFVLTAASALQFTGHAAAQQPSRDLSTEGQSVCRGDAIRFCFFSIANAEALRACLRSNKPWLSTPCQRLITSRSN
jgi:hypothetical protein